MLTYYQSIPSGSITPTQQPSEPATTSTHTETFRKWRKDLVTPERVELARTLNTLEKNVSAAYNEQELAVHEASFLNNVVVENTNDTTTTAEFTNPTTIRKAKRDMQLQTLGYLMRTYGPHTQDGVSMNLFLDMIGACEGGKVMDRKLYDLVHKLSRMDKDKGLTTETFHDLWKREEVVGREASG